MKEYSELDCNLLDCLVKGKCVFLWLISNDDDGLLSCKDLVANGGVDGIFFSILLSLTNDLFDWGLAKSFGGSIRSNLLKKF